MINSIITPFSRLYLLYTPHVLHLIGLTDVCQMPIAELDVEVPVAEHQRSPHQLPERLALEVRIPNGESELRHAGRRVAPLGPHGDGRHEHRVAEPQPVWARHRRRGRGLESGRPPDLELGGRDGWQTRRLGRLFRVRVRGGSGHLLDDQTQLMSVGCVAITERLVQLNSME